MPAAAGDAFKLCLFLVRLLVFRRWPPPAYVASAKRRKRYCQGFQASSR